MQGEVADEVRRRAEPEIVVYGEEEDAVYWARMGVEEDFGEDEQGNAMIPSFDPSQFVSRRKYEQVLEELKAAVPVREYERELAALQAKNEELQRELDQQRKVSNE